MKSILFALALLTLAGCGYGKTACTVIDAAEKACVVVQYMGPDGKIVKQRIAPQDLKEAANRSAQRETLQLGGVPGSAEKGAP